MSAVEAVCLVVGVGIGIIATLAIVTIDDLTPNDEPRAIERVHTRTTPPRLSPRAGRRS